MCAYIWVSGHQKLHTGQHQASEYCHQPTTCHCNQPTFCRFSAMPSLLHSATRSHLPTNLPRSLGWLARSPTPLLAACMPPVPLLLSLLASLLSDAPAPVTEFKAPGGPGEASARPPRRQPSAPATGQLMPYCGLRSSR